MNAFRFSEIPISVTLRQDEASTPITDTTGKLGISVATFYAWRKRFGTMETGEIRELLQLREENLKIKRLVADLSLDKTMLEDVISKKIIAPMRRFLILSYLR